MVDEHAFAVSNRMIRYLIRNAVTQDLSGLQRLAAMLNTLNLPNEKSALFEVLERSEASFNGKIESPFEREYVFVLEDRVAQRIVGTSQVIAQHGTRESPHLFFEVSTLERYSNSIDRHFKHQVLRLGSNYDGPTEIGGLVVDPDYRHAKERLGRQLSLIRFIFMAMHQTMFRDRVLAELLPPLFPNGQSLLWESLGRRFTGLDYTDADHISRTNKEFITGLFPSGQIYTCLFSEEVQNMIGTVGEKSLPAKKLLESIGFSYKYRVDPFDGGPHYEADFDDIEPIQNSTDIVVQEASSLTGGEPWLVAAFDKPFAENAHFVAALINAQLDARGHKLWCERGDLADLGLSGGSLVRAYPFALKA
jgi:arginine N-succinyltransferase